MNLDPDALRKYADEYLYPGGGTHLTPALLRATATAWESDRQRLRGMEEALRGIHAEAVRDPLYWNLPERMGNIEATIDGLLPGLHGQALTNTQQEAPEQQEGQR